MKSILSFAVATMSLATAAALAQTTNTVTEPASKEAVKKPPASAAASKPPSPMGQQALARPTPSRAIAPPQGAVGTGTTQPNTTLPAGSSAQLPAGSQPSQAMSLGTAATVLKDVVISGSPRRGGKAGNSTDTSSGGGSTSGGNSGGNSSGSGGNSGGSSTGK